ncbi:MAG: divalent-cation tolerance protein CutA [Balneolales bacterium]
MRNYFVYITTSNTDEARTIGSLLVEEKLAACVNIIDSMKSIYWWEGEIQEDQESILIAKTTEEHITTLTNRVKELHSYDCPCVVAMPIETGNPEYLKWIGDSTS